jgi:hypothetical protein
MLPVNDSAERKRPYNLFKAIQFRECQIEEKRKIKTIN